ncbi:hypothetical protein CHLRE_01g049000v5 [Chlamydomonas reinhardtii]|uniref:4a-hydroxytetrahydrobiopterin dehydratase n=1 Tax=Chlamydomonas reinhardtii TaxID=3055 RepID=A8HN94_CHLRE|nr:uncharacterized protein CHLRE_01g049000v5 [Chlamydomonas reinhardtii]PNW88881.1 hypothetical protein CHLRE_01g049000v5 [Chlamydomonas reinhardtii]|eukprot:XP_001689751.1 predicted protein [Chlamydomonas reinhardtii]
MNSSVLSVRQVGRQARPFTVQPPRRCSVIRHSQAGGDVRGSKMEKGMFGENFGARDPFAGEIETNFGEKVLGNYNTEHLIKPPDTIKSVMGLSARKCQDNVATLKVLSEEQRELLRNQVPGWKVAQGAEGRPCVQQSWTLKDEPSAVALAAMVAKVASDEGHSESLTLTHKGAEVVAQLCTKSLGGLTENDFIVASKINDLNLADLLPKRKQRFWA